MNSFEGSEAVDEIARQWALHDGTIQFIALRAEPGGVMVEATCAPRAESPVKELRLIFSGVSRFDFQWSKDQEFYFVSGYKAAVQESGQVYFSVDPYDDRVPSPDPRDGGVVEARSLRAEFTMK